MLKALQTTENISVSSECVSQTFLLRKTTDVGRCGPTWADVGRRAPNPALYGGTERLQEIFSETLLRRLGVLVIQNRNTLFHGCRAPGGGDWARIAKSGPAWADVGRCGPTWAQKIERKKMWSWKSPILFWAYHMITRHPWKFGALRLSRSFSMASSLVWFSVFAHELLYRTTLPFKGG